MALRTRTFVATCGLTVLSACTLLSGVGDLESPAAESDGSSTPSSTTDGSQVTNNDGSVIGPNDSSLPTADSPPTTDGNDGAVVGPLDCNNPPTDPSLIAYYAFDDATGATVKDCTNHGHNGTIVGTPTWTTGKHGGALSFNGTNNCVNLGAATALKLTTFTMTAWLNVTNYTSTGVNGYVAGKTASNAGTLGWRFATFDTPNRFEAKIASGAFTLASPGGQVAAAWIHVGLVLAPGRADIYVGGARVAHDVSAPAITEDGAASLRIGCNDGAKDFFTGLMDDLLIYGRALNDAEVAALAK